MPGTFRPRAFDTYGAYNQSTSKCNRCGVNVWSAWFHICKLLIQGDLFSNPCESCGGSGDMPGVACVDCDGTGRVSVV